MSASRSILPTVHYSVSSTASVQDCNGPENGSSSNAEPFAPVSFDDFHNSIMSGDSALNHFPMPGNGALRPRLGSDVRFPDIHPSNSCVGWGDESPKKITRNDSIENKHSGVRGSAATGLPLSPVRPRRVSDATHHNNDTQMGRTPAPRAARKSIGPGAAFLFPSIPSRQPNLPPTAPKNSADSVHVQPRPRNLDSSGKPMTELRSLKAKSFHPQMKEHPGASLSVPWDTARPRSSSSHLTQDPSKNVPSQRTTPSSGRRMSVIPPRPTGLGARTVSPIDARRMRRMSIAPQPPPVPRTPIESEQSSSSRPRSSAQSPSYLPRKSVTPSSTRATPDPNRRAPSGTPNRMRTPVHFLQQKSSQTFQGSRIPTPKPRSESVGLGPAEEEVPPVPAIPRAYGSPKDGGGHESSVQMMAGEEASQRTARTPTSTTTAAVPAARKSLHQLKLPPLHLLPLSAPIAAKVESLKDRPATDAKPQTPSSQVPVTKTPSTPLTASKASFFGTHENDDERVAQIRSTTSHYLNTTSSTPVRAFSSSSALGNLDAGGSSLCPTESLEGKRSGESIPLRQYPVGEYTLKALQLPRFPMSRPQTQASALSPNSEPFNPSFDAGRSSTTGSELFATRNRENNFKIENGSGLAFAESRGLSPFKSFAPSVKTRPALQLRTQDAVAAGGGDLAHASAVNVVGAKQPGLSEELEKSAGRTTSSSILSPVQRIISSAKLNAGTSPQSALSSSEADDAAADEEMKKLNSKKKDFEDSAKKLDELRRKAVPKGRVGPAQALKIANLNIFERGEIIDFKDIYFCGTPNAKKRVGDLSAQAANFGYDDDKGDYHIVLGDHLAYRYEVLDVLGKGSFGQVMRCIDHKTGGLVAVKIIRNRKRFHQQALIEVDLLQKLKEWVSESIRAPCEPLRMQRPG